MFRLSGGVYAHDRCVRVAHTRAAMEPASRHVFAAGISTCHLKLACRDWSDYIILDAAQCSAHSQCEQLALKVDPLLREKRPSRKCVIREQRANIYALEWRKGVNHPNSWFCGISFSSTTHAGVSDFFLKTINYGPKEANKSRQNEPRGLLQTDSVGFLLCVTRGGSLTFEIANDVGCSYRFALTVLPQSMRNKLDSPAAQPTCSIGRGIDEANLPPDDVDKPNVNELRSGGHDRGLSNGLFRAEGSHRYFLTSERPTIA